VRGFRITGKQTGFSPGLVVLIVHQANNHMINKSTRREGSWQHKPERKGCNEYQGSGTANHPRNKRMSKPNKDGEEKGPGRERSMCTGPEAGWSLATPGARRM
jgi:hypothetical protein